MAKRKSVKIAPGLLEKTVKRLVENALVGEAGVLDIHRALKDPNLSDIEIERLNTQKMIALRQLAMGRKKGEPPPVPPKALMDEAELKARSPEEINKILAQASSKLAVTKDPAERQKISGIINVLNQQLSSMIPQQQPQVESYMENIKYIVGKMVEDTMLKRAGTNKPRVAVPMPRNPIMSPPKGDMGTKELVNLLNGIEQMQSLEDLSPEDKQALAQARELMAGVIKGKTSSGPSGMRQEEAPPDPEIEKWIVANKKRFIDQYGKEKGEKVLYATAWKRHNKKD